MELTLAVGEKQFIPIEGYGWYFVAGSGPIELELREQDGRVDQEIILQPGQGPQGADRFSGFTVKNLHSTAQTITFYIGERRFVDNRQVGIVSVVNADRSRTDDGIAHQAVMTQGAVSGLYSAAMMRNPAGSGKRMYVNRLVMQTEANGPLELAISSDEAALAGDANTGNLTQTSGFSSSCKKVGADGSSAGRLQITRASLTEATFFNFKQREGSRAECQFTEPYLLMPNTAIGVIARNPNDAAYCTVEWFEEVIA